MTCVWKGLIESLRLKKMKPANLLLKLQNENKATPDMLYNGKPLTTQNYAENISRIKELTAKNIKMGYDCGGCDPLLLLVGQVYCVSIEHMHEGIVLRYTNIKSDKLIKVESDSGHFWSVTQLSESPGKKKREEKPIKNNNVTVNESASNGKKKKKTKINN